jgi:rRNA-processing protein FCF1
MITRITLALDQDLVRALKRLAKAESVSVSEFVGRELKATIRRRRSFRQARTRALSRLRNGIDLRWTPAPSRDELHRR